MNYITDERITPYKIGLDENQFHLIEEFVTEKGENIGKKYDITKGYFTSFKALLSRVVILLVHNSDYDSINAYIDACKEKHLDLMNGFSEFLNEEKWQSLELATQ